MTQMRAIIEEGVREAVRETLPAHLDKLWDAAFAAGKREAVRALAATPPTEAMRQAGQDAYDLAIADGKRHAEALVDAFLAMLKAAIPQEPSNVPGGPA